jgi:phosphoribosylanthranilate isomerase
VSKVRIKICGMRESTNIESVLTVNPDYMGFIFYKESPRFVGEDFVLPEHFPKSISKVGVFVNTKSAEIQKQADLFQLDLLQLHGDESVEQCSELRKHRVKIIKVFSVDGDFDFGQTKLYSDVVDYVMFDTKGKNYGGNAKQFNWSILEKYDQQIPFFLSGGISPSNVYQLKQLRGMNIHAIDVNSGVENVPGLKDVQKINDLITELKSVVI